MAEQVFIHIGLPKTATTYLQTIMWGARDQMGVEGVLVPGKERRDHLWASRLVRGEAARDQPDPRAESAWDRLCAEIQEWPDRAVLSHEFFAAATAEQAQAMVDRLQPAEVHLVVTAREPLGLFAAGWQESLKNCATAPMSEFSTKESGSPAAIWNWRTLDLTLVLRRWGPTVPAARVHVLPLPRAGAPRETIWHRFADTVGMDSHDYDLSGSFPNASMGVVEAETLRRVNEHLVSRNELVSALERGNYLRTFLADERLVPREGARYWPLPEQVEDCRLRGRRAEAFVREQGFHVVGDPADLLVPDELPDRRRADSVTDTEVAEAATDLIAVLLTDVRDLRRQLSRARRQAAQPPPPSPPASVWQQAAGRVRRRLRRERT